MSLQRLKRVLLVDDQTLFSQSLKRVLELSADDLEIVAVASNGHKAIEFVEQHRPDVVLMDVKMPEMDGVEATRIISDRYPEVNILMLTTFDNDTYVYDAISYGAKGYLLKDISPDVLIHTIRNINDPMMQISPKIVHNMVRHWEPKAHAATRRQRSVDDTTAGIDRKTRDAYRTMLQRLSNRERDVFRSLIRRKTNKEIAVELSIAEQTVRNHISEIYSKLDIHHRLELIDRFSDVLP